MDRSQEHAGLTRRQFHRYAAGALAGAAASSFVSGRAAAQDGDDAATRSGPYIDVHTHIGQVWNTYDPMTADGLLEWMDEHNVQRAVVLPLTSPESSSYLSTTDFVLRETEPHRDRLIPFCCMDPRTSYQGGHEGLVSMLKRWKDAGAMGFGEHKTGVAIDDDRNIRLYAACAELDLPVLFHLDNQRNTDQPGLPGLEKVLNEFPELPFIGHAQGWWASIGGDVEQAELQRYPMDSVKPGGAIDRLMDEHPNLYGDLSAGSGANAITRDPEFGKEFLIRRADRLMFGTDYLRPGQPVPQIELYANLDLPEEVRAKIFRENAKRVLKLT